MEAIATAAAYTGVIGVVLTVIIGRPKTTFDAQMNRLWFTVSLFSAIWGFSYLMGAQ